MNEIVEAFEASRAKDECDIQSFLPSKDSPDYRPIALELMRVDLEYCRRRGVKQPLDDYRNRFADILSDPDSFKALAFEEYRLRLLDGEAAKPTDYRRYGIDTDDWPTDIASGLESEDTNENPLEDLGHEVTRLVDAVQDFPVAGQQFAEMQVIAQIGEGTFGRVYLARQSELSDRFVVLKVSSAGSLEPQRLARLQHTNIVPIYSVHQCDLLSAICMPFFGVTTLSAVIKNVRSSSEFPRTSRIICESILATQNDSPLSPEPKTVEKLSATFGANGYVDGCLELMGGIAAGLAHAVDRGILHRDLKPANILLCDDGTPMLLDFNVSDDVVAGGQACLTAGGTLPYMSPEQLESVLTGLPVDERSDIFSFGIILFELLTGEHPFPTEYQHRHGDNEAVSVFDIVEKSIDDRNATPKTIREKNPDIPPSVAALVEKCIAPDPNRRYQKISELAEDIARHQANLPLKYCKATSLSERAKKWARRHPRLSSLWAVTTISVIVVAVICSMLVARNAQLRRSEARGFANKVSNSLPLARAFLTSPTIDAPAFEEGQRIGNELLTFNSGNSPFDYFSALPGKEANDLRSDLIQLSYLLAVAELRGGKKEHLTENAERALVMNRTALSFCDDQEISAVLSAQQVQLKSAIDGTQAPDADMIVEESLFERDTFLAASQLAVLGKWNEAIPLLEELCRNEPHSFANHLLLGNAYASVERLSDAERSFSVCVALSPESIHGYWHRGLARLQSRNYQSAIGDFSRFIEKKPQWYAAFVNRALAYAGIDELNLAVQDLNTAASIQPERLWAFHLRSKYYLRLGKKKKAEEDRLMALELAPRSADEWILRGLASKDDDQAIEAFRSALQVNPRSRRARRNIASVYSEKKRDSAAALKIMERLVEENPNNATDLMSRAVLRARLDDVAGIDDARASLAMRKQPFDLYRAACTFALLSKASKQNEENALAFLAESLSLDPSWAKLAAQDLDFENLHANPWFKRLVSASQRIGTLQQTLRRLNPTPAKATPSTE